MTQGGVLTRESWRRKGERREVAPPRQEALGGSYSRNAAVPYLCGMFSQRMRTGGPMRGKKTRRRAGGVVLVASLQSAAGAENCTRPCIATKPLPNPAARRDATGPVRAQSFLEESGSSLNARLVEESARNCAGKQFRNCLQIDLPGSTHLPGNLATETLSSCGKSCPSKVSEACGKPLAVPRSLPALGGLATWRNRLIRYQPTDCPEVAGGFGDLACGVAPHGASKPTQFLSLPWLFLFSGKPRRFPGSPTVVFPLAALRC